MKRKWTGLLCLMLALSMTACGSGTSSSTDSTSETTTEAASADESGSDESAAEIEVADYNVSDYLTLGDYTGFTVDKEKTEVTDDDLETEIDTQLEENAEEVDSTEAVQDEDYVTVNYTLTVDGETIAEEEDSSICIGFAELGSEVDEKLTGANVGDKLEVSVTLDSTYGDEYEGKTGEYALEVTRVYNYVTPELTADYVKEYTSYSSIDEYKTGLRESLEEDAENASQEEAGELALSMAVENATISGYPQDLYDSIYAEWEESYEYYAEMFGMEREDMISDDDLASEALSEVYTRMVVKAIAEKEGIELTDEDYDEYLSDNLDAYGYDTVDEMVEDYGEDDLRSDALYAKVRDFVLETCTLNEMSAEDYEAKYYSDDEEDDDSDEEDDDSDEEDVDSDEETAGTEETEEE